MVLVGHHTLLSLLSVSVLFLLLYCRGWYTCHASRSPSRSIVLVWQHRTSTFYVNHNSLCYFSSSIILPRHFPSLFPMLPHNNGGYIIILRFSAFRNFLRFGDHSFVLSFRFLLFRRDEFLIVPSIYVRPSIFPSVVLA